MRWDLLCAVGLALSMFTGIVATIISLLVFPTIAEYSSIRLLLGALAGAVAWKVGQRWWRQRRQ